MRQCLLTALLLLACSLTAQTQQDDGWDDFMQALSEDFEASSSDDEAAEDFQAQMEELAILREHPLNINACSLNELLALPFLTESEADAIIGYRLFHGPFRSIGELMLVSRLSTMHYRWLRMLVVIGEADEKTATALKKKQRHDVMTRLDIPLYQREGWPWQRGIGNRLRYKGRFGTHWDIGLRAEHDPGEPMFTRQNPFYDVWGGHVMLKDWKLVRTLIVGDYKASFGEGLVLNSNFQLGKQMTGLWRTTASLRPHRSMEESRFLRGAAATIGAGQHMTFTALYSFRSLDATVQADNTVKSISTTGLHRTPSELSHKGTLGNHTTAVHAEWHNRLWKVGATATYLYYDHQFKQDGALYRQIYPEGYQFGIAGVDYGLHTNHFHLS